MGIEEGTKLPKPIVEFYYKEDRLDDPFINDDHVFYLGLASEEELDQIKTLALQVNAALLEIFANINIRLIDFKIEIGKTKKGELLLADTCRLWDMGTNEHLDKDVYRRDLGDIVPVYEEVLNRLEKENSACI